MRGLLIILGLSLLAISGCKVYSFTGASVPPDVKSVTIEQFRNLASNGPALLSQVMTDRLKTKFVSEASLRQVSSEGDLVFRGSITGYSFTSQAPTPQVQSGVNRLTITIQVTFVNNKYPKETWKQPETFTRYADVPGNQNLQDVESQLNEEIVKQLVDDVFNKAMVKW